MQKSRERQKPDEDSEDELAGDSLLNNPAQQPMRSSLQSDVPASEYSKARSNRTLAEDRNKPLPPIPATDQPGDTEQSKKARPALASKSTNRKIPRKPANALTKPNISYPVLQDSEDNDHNSALRAVYGASSLQGTTGLQTSVDDAEILSRKISGLMKQAAAREAEQAERLKAATRETTTKASPLQRSRAAITKATHAIASHLSNSGRRPSTSKARQSGSLDSDPNGLLGFEYPAEPSSPGVSSLLDIPRRPLPVYESMRSTGRSSDSSQNPFLDGNWENGQLSPELQADFDFAFNKRRGKGKKSTGGQPFFRGSKLKNATVIATDAQPPQQFSNKISGLAQHPNTMVFSSTPIGFSTPTSRLNLAAMSPQESPLRGIAAQTPSILDFSFEESDDDLSGPKDSQSLDRSLSVKRKSAQEDLRSQLSPSSKRAKNGSDKQMDTKDSGPLIEKDPYTQPSRPVTAESRINGLGIFDAATGEGLLNGVGDKLKRPRIRNKAAKRLSIPTPNSILFSRESRAHYRLRDTSDGDSGDVDELQIDDGGYKVRSVKN